MPGALAEESVDLGRISAAVHRCCMGLPQELVDHIMDMLHDDLRALKACSLTCKAMFVSTRHLIHQTLRLTLRNNRSILPLEKKRRHLGWECYDSELRFLPFMGERGFLQYARHVYIRMGDVFTPDLLTPHLIHFQSLDRVHSLTIEAYDSMVWRYHHKTFFAHFYPTLTSLTLHHPLNHYQYVLQFALRFPNLQNLAIEHPANSEWIRPDSISSAVVDLPPPLRGNFRLVGVGAVQWPTEFSRELPGGINFRSVELQDVPLNQGQKILRSCAATLEDLTIMLCGDGAHSILPPPTVYGEMIADFSFTGNAQLAYLDYTENVVLRRLTFRIPFPHISVLPHKLTATTVPTIFSLFFCEFVLELGKLPSRFTQSSSKYWGCWADIDSFLAERFAERVDFRVIIRTGKLYDRETFQEHAKERFPLLTRKGWVRFETSYSIDQYWR